MKPLNKHHSQIPYDIVSFGFQTILIVLAGLQIVVYQFYSYVFKINQRRDKETLLFPITNCFYKIIKALTRSLICFIVFLTVFNHTTSKYYFIQLPVLLITWLSFSVLTIFTQVCNFFVSLVAIYKFCLYYFPSTEPRVSKFVKDTNKIILLSTVLFVIKEISYPIVYFLQVPDIITKSQMQYLFAITIFIPIGFLISTSLLYIPIMISVRKSSHLPSAQQCSPEKYILAQTLIVLILKLVYFEVLFEYFLNPNFSIFRITGSPQSIDMVSTPLIIQMSYLFSNKRNVNALFSSFKLNKFMKIMFNGQTNSVAPNLVVYSITEAPQN
ncbi:Serpentine Receptor, class Z [Caenorhabditis elegans]|uniref:Serpentine Receptor, class Z n=1 Tax=Caenorhabditis elegans TaxID=6239 RepID=Q9XV13_CAEEL|nr:Serpentine Receptor, class Z [Caenorhabditis elegans]CAB04407.2 Serpentine Receptor, class Z [Caenorhabditis elegans]|eukprot:NP_507981.2 Serpentine Receptor, class Z [Caenorhabditis elegans]